MKSSVKLFLAFLLTLILSVVAFANWDSSTNMQALTVSGAFTQVQDSLKAIDNTTGTAPTTISAGTTFQLEGATADGFETSIQTTDPTADRTFTLPNDSGTAMISSLSTNATETENSIWGASNGLAFEGETENEFETTITPTDPTADRIVTLQDASGTVYVTGGTDISLADGGTGQSLSDPGADRIMFWDDSETAVAFLTAGNGLTITTTSIAVDIAEDANSPYSDTDTQLGPITIAASKRYLVLIDIEENSGTASFPFLRFNSLSTSIYSYQYTTTTHATSPTESHSGDDSHTAMSIAPSIDEDSGFFKGTFIIDTNKSAGNVSAFVTGHAVMSIDDAGGGDGDFATVTFSGAVNSDITVTSFELGSSQAMNATIQIFEL